MIDEICRAVTPFVGVWIETFVTLTYDEEYLSHPSWVCGLKLLAHLFLLLLFVSHPSWVCGLKLAYQKICNDHYQVTPFVGVWIETFPSGETPDKPYVTPFVGVWIETC